MSKELLFSITKKDFRIDTFRSGGKGGQHQNKRDSGVRITHIESGATGESREERSQKRNKEKALKKLVKSDKFKKWYELEAAKIMGTVRTKEELKEKVKESTQSKYIKVETGKDAIKKI